MTGVLGSGGAIGLHGATFPRAYAAALGATLLWSTGGPLAKVLVPETGLIALGAVRALVGASVLLAILGWRQGRQAFAVPPADLARMAALTLLGLVVCQIAWLYALSRIPVSVTVILSNTSPMFAGLMAALWLAEPLRARAALGLVVSFGGIVLLVGQGEGPAGRLDLGGVAGALLSAATWAGYYVGGRALLARYDPLRLVTINLVIAACCWVPLALIFEPPWTRVAGPTVWLGAVYLGAFPMALGSVLWYGALRHVRAAQIGAFQSLTPVWTALIASVWLGEAITPTLVVGMLLVFAGLRLAQTR